jgi:hypothetical protein
MDSHAWLKGSPADRPNPSRVVHDVEISAGYMHSGYPVRLGGPASQGRRPPRRLRRRQAAAGSTRRRQAAPPL